MFAQRATIRDRYQKDHIQILDGLALDRYFLDEAEEIAPDNAMAKHERERKLPDLQRFLTGHGAGQSRLRFAPAKTIFVQGDAADSLFYIERGWIKRSILAPNGKEAVVGLAGDGEFFGMRCLVGQHRRGATVTTLTDCNLVRISAAAAIRLLRENPDFAEMLVDYLVWENISRQESIVDHLINSSERRLARALLKLADSSSAAGSGAIPPPINQAVLALMIGTTRGRVSGFMNKFRRQGFIEYDRAGNVRVRDSLLNVLRTG
jgi:CRP/FNR family transcriptional regulator, cyclic AMP receptor protein